MNPCITYQMELRDRDGYCFSRCNVRKSARQRLVAPAGQKWICVGWVNPLAPNDWLDDTDTRYAAVVAGYDDINSAPTGREGEER